MDRLVYVNGAAKVIGQAITIGSLYSHHPGCASLLLPRLCRIGFLPHSTRVVFRRVLQEESGRIDAPSDPFGSLILLGKRSLLLAGHHDDSPGGDLAISLPFTGKVKIERPGDAQYLESKVAKDDLLDRESFALIKDSLKSRQLCKDWHSAW